MALTEGQKFAKKLKIKGKKKKSKDMSFSWFDPDDSVTWYKG